MRTRQNYRTCAGARFMIFEPASRSLEQKIFPHDLQWWRLLSIVNAAEHARHADAALSGSHIAMAQAALFG